MRPLRLELEGFSAFRDRVEVDFDDAELFVLTGPTGSGKSSLIDAMTFALYGSVPRYDDRKLVHPVIHQGRVEAKVRFDFAVDGRTFTAVRVVRRVNRPTGPGAVTKEARLESGDDVLAGSEKELSEQVERLLGLSFDQFTKCVVLPQGEFARFLHDKPSDRQRLLARLLGLGAYRRMHSLANAKASAERQRAQVCEEQLAELPQLDEAARREADKRVAALEKLNDRIERERPEIERLAERVRASTEQAERLVNERKSLEEVEPPRGVDALSEAVAGARDALAKASTARRKAERALDRARQARKRAGDADALKEAARAHVERGAAAERLEAARAEAAAAKKVEQAASRDAGKAEREVRAARTAVEQARAEHAAHALAVKLKKGQPCPVCRRKVTTRPKRAAPVELSRAERALRSAETRRQKALAAHRSASEKRAAADRDVSAIRKQLRGLDALLKKAPAAGAVQRKLERIVEADRAVAEAEGAARKGSAAEAEARESLERAEGAAERAWRDYEAARDRVAALEPPAADRSHLARSWGRLVEWARERAAAHRERESEARQAAMQAEALRREQLDRLLGACVELEVTADEQAPAVAVAAALGEARARVRAIADALERAERLRAQIEQARHVARIAGALARHLRSDGFERWLLNEAVERLVVEASGILRDLSGGQYSFAHDDKNNFEIVDHRNADERRPVKTLSGGETFLASLSLALTLVEQIAELASEGTARLESIFLDEGFGSLDPDTLDVVAATIEELSTRNRAVGLVTHVRDLAERIPVQYRVTKGPATSTVERVAP